MTNQSLHNQTIVADLTSTQKFINQSNRVVVAKSGAWIYTHHLIVQNIFIFWMCFYLVK